MVDPFLEEIFLSNAIAAALSRNTVYESSCSDERKRAFRRALAKQLQDEALLYARPVSDTEHYRAIRRISDVVSDTCPKTLVGARFRYGTAQKAFNLYLKFLWRSGAISEPPHCPVDSVMLREAGIDGAWTRCDSEAQYSEWINALRKQAGQLTLGEWEHRVWLKSRRS
jgi:hypothetical protein